MHKCDYVRTTIDLPDDLYRALKARAALSGVTMRDLVRRLIEHGLRQPGGLPPPEGGAASRRPSSSRRAACRSASRRAQSFGTLKRKKTQRSMPDLLDVDGVMRVGNFVTALFFAGLLVVTIGAVAQPDTLIVAGERVGPYRLGMTLAEVIGMMGSTGVRGSTTMPRSYGMAWRDMAIFFSLFSATHTVSGVTLYDSEANRAFKTAEGLGLGSPSAELDRFGLPQWKQQFQSGEARAYWTVGLFAQVRDGVLVALGVFDHRTR